MDEIHTLMAGFEPQRRSMSQPELTEASTRAIQAALELAKENSNAAVTPLHLASALLSPSGSLLNSIISRAGASPDIVERELAKRIVRLPVSDPPPSDVALSPKLSAVIQVSRRASSWFVPKSRKLTYR